MGGLASENVRWAESVQNFKSQGVTLCGDVLLISAFVSYVGYFTKKYRNELMEKFWVPYINKLKAGGPRPGKPGRGPQGRQPPNLPASRDRGSGRSGPTVAPRGPYSRPPRWWRAAV